MKTRFIFAEVNALIEIERGIAARLGYTYSSHEWIAENGCLPIHESYQDTVVSVLKEFNGVYQIKELVEVKINDNGSEEIIFRNVDKNQFFRSQIK